MDRLDDFYNELLLAFAMPDRMFWIKWRRASTANETWRLFATWSYES